MLTAHTNLIPKAMTNSTPFSPEHLGMQKAAELVSARQDTFYYRGLHKRIIEHKVVNDHRWNRIKGPLLYIVSDKGGLIRYVGKWVSPTALNCRWIRHGTIHHHEKTRNLYLEQLESSRGPLSIWSVSIEELLPVLPNEIKILPLKEIAKGLEALLINTQRSQLLWNKDTPSIAPLFQTFSADLQHFPIKH